MCGLVGIFDPTRSWDAALAERRIADACQRLAHRGPDSGGLWIAPGEGVALGHRRLAIVDLSAQGHQPMVSASGRFVVAYNGELYDHRPVRRELEERGQRFRGTSDTEVLLAAIETWGVEPAIRRFAGMFAIACWDRLTHALHLVRDRLGKKPLFLARAGHALIFASELKALAAWPNFERTIDRTALTAFMRHNYVPAPLTIYREARKLPAATILTLTVADLGHAGIPVDRARVWWSARAMAERGQRDPLRIGDDEATDALEALLSQAVGERMIADVPLGAFLSGGIDSSAVAALMQAQATRPIRTFTIGFREARFDESRHAAAVARHLGTDHTELHVTPGEAREVIPALPEIYDEPFADVSQIPTCLLARLARRHVTVALSGDGGDETLCGYDRYFLARKVASAFAVPAPLRRGLAAAVGVVPPAAWDALLTLAGRRGAGADAGGLNGGQVRKLAWILGGQDRVAMYREGFLTHWTRPDELVVGGSEPTSVLTTTDQHPRLRDFEQTMMWLDTVTYLPDDILVKLDRATMAVGLEARCPLLDHRVIEMAWRLPLAMKLRDGQGKWILRRILARHVPEALFDRPKMGFGVPIGDWLRGPLRPWAEDLLAEARLRQDGFFRPEPVRATWADHLAERRNVHFHLWDVLMFQAWHDRWAGDAATRSTGEVGPPLAVERAGGSWIQAGAA